MASNSSSGTIAARFLRVLRLALLAPAAACARLEVPSLGTEPLQPEILVALATDAAGADLGGGDALVLTGDQGNPHYELPVGAVARIVPAGDRVSLRMGGAVAGTATRLLAVPADPSGLVRVRGRSYRGTVEITATTSGLLVVNRLGVEQYLGGVVSSELGRRAPGEHAALEAQAIASRTRAFRALGRSRTQGYDLRATIADQVYDGAEAETVEARAAVAATRGMILTYAGQPIEAFFHSTCGGRTAAGEEVFAGGTRPYLRSVPDVDPAGASWCAISPRFRWVERWTGERLLATLRATLPALGIDAARVTDLQDVIITGQTASGRVSGLSFRFRGEAVPVSGSAAVRSALRPEAGQLLRSATFRVVASRAGGRVTELALEGQGAGHGVGLCQWGAVGRARAGFTAEQILAAYFPGTTIEQRW